MDNVYNMNTCRAMRALLDYLGEQYRDRLEIIDGLPEIDRAYIYNADQLGDCWSVYVPEDHLICGSARLICISKKTYTVCFDGRVGE